VRAGSIGALVYYLTTATSLPGGLPGVIKTFLWPALASAAIAIWNPENKITSYFASVSYHQPMQSEKFSFIIGVFLVLVVFVAGCTGTNSFADNTKQVPLITTVNGSAIVFNESDNGNVYSIPRTTEFTINLTESFATGTKWHASPSPGIKILDDNYYANPKSIRFDVGGTRSWHLLAAVPGQQSFHADYFFEGVNETPQKSYNLALHVLP
jgi:predicted secreted protein